MPKKALVSCAFLLLLFACPMLRADTLDFTLTGEGSTYAFQLPSTLSPNGNAAGFSVANVIITLDGQDELAADVAFFNQSLDGGLEFVRDTPPITGSQVYTASQSTITFNPGIYHLTNLGDDAPYTLVIADSLSTSPSPVPEPPTVFLILTGMLATAMFGMKHSGLMRHSSIKS